MSLLDDLAEFEALPEEARSGVKEIARAKTADMVWVPNDGPQTEAFFCEADELFYGGSAGGGKLLRLDEWIATPAGFTEMGSLRVGDEVLDRDGKQCLVTHLSPIDPWPELWEFLFDDGTKIVSCVDHQWLTFDADELAKLTQRDPEWKAARRAARPSRATGKRSAAFTAAISARNSRMAADKAALPLPEGSVRTTRQIIETLVTPSGRNNHAVPLAGCLDLPDAKLPIDPYVLGAWLGDGSKEGGGFTNIDPELNAEIKATGFEMSHYAGGKSHCILKLKPLLREVGVLNFKHIPVDYLRASRAQRLALLQGLMDTNGTVAKHSGAAEFCNTNEHIIDGVQELICSLGWKVNRREGRAKLYGKDCGPKWTLKWSADDIVFRLPRKAALQKLATRRTTKFRYIVDATPAPSEPGRCIQVDSPSHTYLVGRSFVPTHNSDLMIGLSLTEHKKSLILRRTNKEASKLFERYRDILGHRDGWNGQDMVWRLPEGRVVDIGGCQLEDDKQKYKGAPHDLIGFDEVSDFTETQYTFITIWNRSADSGQRCRVVAAGNPPTRPEGYWVVRYWAPWLDPTHPNPAKPGELRWFLGGEEVDGPGPYDVDGKLVSARSRTFLPARLDDNPDLALTNYDSVLAGLPEGLRQAYREGRFDIEAADDHWQAIPTAWVREAQARWKPQAPTGIPMCAIGVDVAQGGTDSTVLAIRHDGWFAPLLAIPGAQTPNGSDVAGLVVAKRRDDAKVIIDIGGGWGGDAYAHLKANHVDVVSYMGVKPSVRRTQDNQLRFSNLRTQAYWQFREALNPDQPGGSPIMLPDDRELLADLTAPTYGPVPGGIALESKKDLVKRISRSPDKGDAVVMAWFSGAKAITDAQHWRRAGPLRRAPKVIFGHAAKRR